MKGLDAYMDQEYERVHGLNNPEPVDCEYGDCEEDHCDKCQKIKEYEGVRDKAWENINDLIGNLHALRDYENILFVDSSVINEKLLVLNQFRSYLERVRIVG